MGGMTMDAALAPATEPPQSSSAVREQSHRSAGWTPWNENWLTAWPEMKPCCRPDTLISGSGSADPDTKDQVAANQIRPGEPKSQKERRGQEAAA